jgi:hypothetical protein
MFLQVWILTEEQKTILPRPLKMAALKNLTINEDACSLCFDKKANTQLLPCKHK